MCKQNGSKLQPISIDHGKGAGNFVLNYTVNETGVYELILSSFINSGDFTYTITGGTNLMTQKYLNNDRGWEHCGLLTAINKLNKNATFHVSCDFVWSGGAGVVWYYTLTKLS